MKRINLREFATLVEQDEALRTQIRNCPDSETAMAEMKRLAGELDYELDTVVPAVEALPDDALAEVAGGFQTNPAVNPYSWFVTLFRRLIDQEEKP